LKNKDSYNNRKHITNINIIEEISGDIPNLSKYDITPQKTLTKSLTKSSLESPIKHTISSMNKARTKEMIRIEIQNKKEENENGKK